MAYKTQDKWVSSGVAQNVLNAAKNIGKTAANITVNSAVNAAKNNPTKTTTTSNTGAITKATNNAATTAAKVVANAVNRLTGGGSSSGSSNTSSTPVETATQTYYSGGSSSGSGSSGGSSSSSGSSSGSTGGGSTRKAVSTDFDSAPVYDANAVYQRYIEDLRRQAEEAYNSNMSSIQRAYDYQSGVLQSERERAKQDLASRYNANLASTLETLAKAYDTQSKSLATDYDETRNALDRSYNSSLSNINDDAEASLRQAYINNMLAKKNIQQEMSAIGLSGGASESTLASLLNQYGNARNDIENASNKSRYNLYETLQNNLSDALKQYNAAKATLEGNRASAETSAREKLGSEYQSNLTNAENAYRSALQNLLNNKLSLETSAQNARQNLLNNFAVNLNSLAVSDPTYLDSLRSMADGLNVSKLAGTAYENLTGGNPTYAAEMKNIANGLNDFSYDPTTASNTYEGVTTRQGLPTPNEAGNAYAKYIAQAQMMRQSGATDDDIKNYLFGTVGNNAGALEQIFANLGLS